MHNVTRRAFLWTLVLVLAVATFAAPRVWQLGEYLPDAFFTGDAYATMAGGFIAGLIMGSVNPGNAFGWGAVIGGTHLLLGLGQLALLIGTAALDPIGIGLLVMMSFLPPLLGACLGELIRR
jgi:sorbitol-specific phosphotransferase system component IIC